MFPNAGGTKELFSKISAELQKDFKCFCYEYPGHGSDKEALCVSIDTLTDKAFEFYNENHVNENDIILFGYSMGTIVAMELLKRIEGISNRIGIILAAVPPRNVIVESSDVSEEENIKNFYMKNGGISDKLINSKLFESLYLPSFRNDYRILREYNYSRIHKKINAEALILYSEDDISYEIITGWSEVFLNEPEYREFSGGHFFIKSHYKEIAQLIKARFYNKYIMRGDLRDGKRKTFMD